VCEWNLRSNWNNGLSQAKVIFSQKMNVYFRRWVDICLRLGTGMKWVYQKNHLVLTKFGCFSSSFLSLRISNSKDSFKEVT